MNMRKHAVIFFAFVLFFATFSLAQSPSGPSPEVEKRVASILGKLGAASRTEAVTLGIRRGLVLL